MKSGDFKLDGEPRSFEIFCSLTGAGVDGVELGVAGAIVCGKPRGERGKPAGGKAPRAIGLPK